MLKMIIFHVPESYFGGCTLAKLGYEAKNGAIMIWLRHIIDSFFVFFLLLRCFTTE